LQASDIGEVTFDDSGVAWDQYRLDAAEVATARKRLAVSFGSCSFTEPIDDLKRLELI
ncbi:MAG: hypothetical protein IH969_08745, partial [Candidatus Krumholzibacteriota bacterium]|nr:hypothetical protein [Candidatus Krumholzibacteriota bacterium]